MAGARLLLATAPFILVALLYCLISYERNQASARDPDNGGVSREKITPSPLKLVEGVKGIAVDKDRNGHRMLWFDTWASARRFLIAYAFVLVPILIGLHMGTFPYTEALLLSFFGFFGKVPPLALTPILILVFGIDELPKIVLVVIGYFPGLVLTANLCSKEVPRELIESAKSRGASEFEVCYRVVLPLIWPKMLDAIRLSLMTGIQCLIAAEFMAATVGLGYRIYLVKRYTAMDIIIPYVLWMTLLLFVADWLISWWIEKRYGWVNQ